MMTIGYGNFWQIQRGFLEPTPQLGRWQEVRQGDPCSYSGPSWQLGWKPLAPLASDQLHLLRSCFPSPASLPVSPLRLPRAPRPSVCPCPRIPKGRSLRLGGCPEGWWGGGGPVQEEAGTACLSWFQSQSTWDFKQLISLVCKTISF